MRTAKPLTADCPRKSNIVRSDEWLTKIESWPNVGREFELNESRTGIGREKWSRVGRKVSRIRSTNYRVGRESSDSNENWVERESSPLAIEHMHRSSVTEHAVCVSFGGTPSLQPWIMADYHCLHPVDNYQTTQTSQWLHNANSAMRSAVWSPMETLLSIASILSDSHGKFAHGRLYIFLQPTNLVLQYWRAYSSTAVPMAKMLILFLANRSPLMARVPDANIFPNGSKSK